MNSVQALCHSRMMAGYRWPHSPSVSVRWCPRLLTAVVTHLVTRFPDESAAELAVGVVRPTHARSAVPDCSHGVP